MKYRGEIVVGKTMSGGGEGQSAIFKREAGIMHKLKHCNIVKFIAFNPSDCSFLLEFLEFQFVHPLKIEGQKPANNLQELMKVLKNVPTTSWEHLLPTITTQILEGLSFLHSHGIAHRDLKPANILVSNQHYCSLSDDIKDEFWKENPIEVKLTDFGECWSGKMSDEESATKTRTTSLYRGTPVYMAPEILNSKLRPGFMKKDQLQKTDIWSFSMVLYSIMNPDRQVPFANEDDRDERTIKARVRENITDHVLPSDSPRYMEMQSTSWLNIYDVYLAGAVVESNQRATTSRLKSILCRKESINPIPLSVSQMSAIEQVNYLRLHGQDLQAPENDGTNACAFLSLKIADTILNLGDSLSLDLLKHKVEDIIINFPKPINEFRNVESMYTLQEALDLLKLFNMLKHVEVSMASTNMRAYTYAGRRELEKILLTRSGTYIITAPPYTFVMSYMNGHWVIVDTHIIDPSLGGAENNNAGIICEFQNYYSAQSWIWRRFRKSKLNSDFIEIHQVLRLESNSSVESHSLLDDLKSFEKEKTSSFRQDAKMDHNSEKNDSHYVKSKQIDSQIKGSHGPSSSSQDRFPQDKLLTSYEFFNFPNTGIEQREKEYYGKHKCPFIPDVAHKLSPLDCMQLINSKFERSHHMPEACKRRAIFLIHGKAIFNPADVKSDMNGTYCIRKENGDHYLELDLNDSNAIVSSKCIKACNVKLTELKDNKKYTKMTIWRNANEYGLLRNIVYFTGPEGEIIKDTILLQYYFDKRISNDVKTLNFQVSPHGNSKKMHQFHPGKKSINDIIRDQVISGMQMGRKRTLEEIQDNVSNHPFVDQPVSKKKIVNIKSHCKANERSKEKNDINNILSYQAEMIENGDSIVIQHADFPEDWWVLGTPRMLDNIKSSDLKDPLTLDPTFNIGKYEVIPLTYRHHILETQPRFREASWKHAALIGPTIVQRHKDANTYLETVACLGLKTGLDKRKKKFGFITDGEDALVAACERTFSNACMMRCCRHFRGNCDKFLSDHKIAKDKKDKMLALVFGPDGLIESRNSDDLEKKLADYEKLFDAIECNKETLESKFYKYLTDRKDSVLKKLIQDIRLLGGLPVDSSGIPSRPYTNQAESINSMLKKKKSAKGHAKKDDINLTEFVIDVYDSVRREQDDEIVMAIQGQGNKYRLTEDAKYLLVPQDEWCNYTDNQKEIYLEKFHRLTSEDIKNKKKIIVPTTAIQATLNRPIIRKLSVDIVKALPDFTPAPILQKNAIDLLNRPGAVVREPQSETNERSNGKIFRVLGNVERNYQVIVKKDKMTCGCIAFKTSKLCKHVVVVAEKENILNHVINLYSLNHRVPHVRAPSPAVGRKIHEPRISRVRNESRAQSTSDKPAFTQVWHNMKPLILTKVSQISEGRCFCSNCGVDFPRGEFMKSPFDICLSHEERWKYPIRESPGMKGISSTYTKKYYCIKKICILERFPYFVPGLVSNECNLILNEQHKRILTEELNVNL